MFRGNKFNIKVPILTLFFIGFLLFADKSFASEKIISFDTDILINKNASVLVTEKIQYDLGESEKHGIFREIPIKYQTPLGNRSISIKVQDVLLDGVSESYIITRDNKNEKIKIGKTEIVISGIHTYTISYEIHGVINYFDEFDEFYWNITGDKWQIPIENVNTKIILPDNIDLTTLKSNCYLGNQGSSEKCEIISSGNYLIAKNARILNPGEGMTIAVGFPKGTVYQPTKLENLIETLKDNAIFILPILVFITMFLVWRKYGRDPKGPRTIMAEYEPPLKLKPTLIGALANERVDNKDITAGIIYLAQQGFLRINKIDKSWILGSGDYELELIKSDLGNLEKTEKSILVLFFENNLSLGQKVRISSFKNNKIFLSAFKSTTKDVYQEITSIGFYEKNPLKAKIPFIILGALFIFLGFFSANIFGLTGVISFLISGIITFIFGSLMGKKTKLGAETKSHVLGFKLFLSMTEKERIDFHNAPEKKPEQFMEFLPYAIALGVEKKWAEQFAGMYIPTPSWYHGNIVGSFVAADFASHMSGLSQSFGKSAISGGSSSSGGGFSGGGFGGGGGGSW